MLPPVTEATKLAPYPTPCPPGGAPNILTWDGTNPISCATGVTVTNGYVGIGTTSPQAALDVAGGVKVGPDSVCNSNKAGTVSYQSGALLVCDGTNLKRIKPTVAFYRFPTDAAYTGDQVCALYNGTCVSQGNGANNYLFCGTAQSDLTGRSAGVECLIFGPP